MRKPGRARRRLLTAIATACVVAAAAGGFAWWRAGRPAPVTPASVEVVPPATLSPPGSPPVSMTTLTVRLAKDQTLGQALARLPIDAAQVQSILKALEGKFPFHRSRPGDQLQIERVAGEKAIRRFSYRQSAAAEWTVLPRDGALAGEKRAVSIATETARVEVEIRGSVWESLQKSGEDPALAVIAADVLAWDVDFYQDVRAGDRLEVVVEKIYADGKLLRYGEVLAVEYAGAVTGKKRLFRYADPSGMVSYYDDEGNSARRGFLKSPLRYAHLTSGFGSRMHPVLGYRRAHQGVDYGAPTGTPVWAVGDGTVALAGWNGGCGRAVILRHRNGLDTIYCHLSALSVHRGARVRQKQVIGAVGQTGLATGPHLHFAVKRSGAFVNPLTLEVPREAPVAKAYRADFDAKLAPLRSLLDGSAST